MQDAGRHGPAWRVLLSVTPGNLPTVGSTPSTMPSVVEDSPALIEALRMLDTLRQENRDLASQVGYLQARVQMQEATILTLLVPHHQSAIDAAKAAESRAERPEIKELAQAIIADQTREIEQMQQWLQAWYGPSPTHTGH